MASEASNERTIVCYISWRGKYVCLDSNKPGVLSLEPIDWFKIKKYQIRIYQYNTAQALACAIRCQTERKEPHVVQLIPNGSSYDILIKDLPNDFDSRKFLFFTQEYDPDITQQKLSSLQNKDLYLCPDADQNKLIMSKEPCILQVFPYVAFIEQSREYISMNESQRSHGTQSQDELYRSTEDDLYIGVSAQGKLIASEGKQGKSAIFTMYKYSYKVEENQPARTAVILYNEKMKMVVCVQDGKDGLALTLQEKQAETNLEKLDVADEKFFVIMGDGSNNVEFTPHEDPDKSIDLRTPGQKDGLTTVYDVTLCNRGRGHWNHFNIQKETCSQGCVLV